MVDEKLLFEIKNTLNKIESYKKNENIGELLVEYGLDINSMSADEITNSIVKYLLNDQERFYYNQFKLYKRDEDLKKISGIVDSLSNLTGVVDILYRERKNATKGIFEVNEIIRNIKRKMQEVPMVRLSCLYGHLENDYKRYSSISIKAGLDQTRVSDTIYNIEHGSAFLRKMKTKELARLKKELAGMKEKSSTEIEERHERYIRTREEYTKELENAILELLREPIILNASMLSINLLQGDKYNTNIDDYGLQSIKDEEFREVSKKEIIDSFWAYFIKHNDDKYDSKTFYRILEDFILYYYTVRIARLENKKDKSLMQINDAFVKQKSMMSELVHYQDLINEKTATLSADEEDTLSLVYSINGV